MRYFVCFLASLFLMFAFAAEKNLNESYRFLSLNSFNKNRDVGYREFKFVTSSNVTKVLADYQVFAIRKCEDPYHPTGDFAALLIKDNELPLVLDTMDEAALFLKGKFKKPANAEDALKIITLIHELFGYEIVEAPPKYKSERHKKDFDVKKDEWQKKFSSSDKKWSLECTLLFDEHLSICNRVTISVDKEGIISVSKAKNVYRLGFYL